MVKTVKVTSKTKTFSVTVAHHEKWSGVPVETEVEFHSHYLQATNIDRHDGSDERPQLFLMHGYGTSSALCWRNVMEDLSKKFDIIALDTPGFGRTNTAAFLHRMSSQEVVTMYCNYFDTFYDAVGLKSPYVVAHSFGGFLFTHCASKFPHSHLMLCLLMFLASFLAMVDWITLSHSGSAWVFLSPSCAPYYGESTARHFS